VVDSNNWTNVLKFRHASQFSISNRTSGICPSAKQHGNCFAKNKLRHIREILY